MFRFVQKREFASDPRAAYTRALVNLVRAGDIAHLLAPAEMFEAFCEAIAEPLELAVAIVIEAPDGLPRSIPWKAHDAEWRFVESGERHAWSNFAELLAPDLIPSLPPDSAGPRSSCGLCWTVQPLGVPLLGIVECGTKRVLGGADYGLLKCMSVRLSAALGRRARDKG